jgi:hypothetical protein
MKRPIFIHFGFTDSAWLFIDIKSVETRDDQDHTVMDLRMGLAIQKIEVFRTLVPRIAAY